MATSSRCLHPPASLAFVERLAYVAAMVDLLEVLVIPRVEPTHVPSGAALLAIQLGEEARGLRGLDVLRLSVDRAPPARS